ncbi:cobyric acid synthase [Hoyosella rhizosphaerae]|uniref:cobyric acid synthase n=1 Tax=Hoyosella rhizosphaerae TaxID=1755582 RepID=UPI001668E97C|nr:cobyric acid synthase [Hoyosella rhizosphaerae]MBN4926267.1 cobyric acid synthase [Hoyosella rhizosphaerae]
MRGAVLIAGTTSDAGKSFITAGVCRVLARRGVSVAPFKAQNMSNNSFVTLDGGEIGRAQALQARACGVAPSIRFNPILLKPGSDRRSQLVIHGHAQGHLAAGDYLTHRAHLRAVAAESLARLRTEFDVVVCEGAGSPAEINLRASDVANMGLAEAADLPVVVVGDIDRGGVLAHFFGTLAVLDPADQRRIAGFVVNKFRGDPALLRPGLDDISSRTGRPVLGTVPFLSGLWIDAEDSLASSVGRVVGVPRSPRGTDWLTVAAVRLPRVSNATDVEALACEPGVVVRWVDDPGSISDADLVVVPGSKATVSDLAWMRDRGLADALVARARRGRPVLGICGGYQMLGHRIVDDVESGSGVVEGLGVFDLDIRFAADKVLAQSSGTGAAVAPGVDVRGFEIHHGRVERTGDAPLLSTGEGSEGSVRGATFGTHWHGLLENDEFRRSFLTSIATLAGRDGFVPDASTCFERERDAQLDLIADAIESHLDMDALERIINGPTQSLPTVTSRLNW